jgi:4-hydroxybenzoate polyprenyltransferase
MNEPIAIACSSTLLFGTLFAIVFGFFAYQRYLRYKETMALAEKGLVSPRYEGNGKGALRWGVTITFLGVALCLGLYPFGWLAAPGEFPLNFGPWMLVGLLPTFFGLSLLVIYILTQKERKEERKQNQAPADTHPDQAE